MEEDRVGRRGSTRRAAWTLLLLLALPAAGAVPVSSEFSTRGSTEFHGQQHLEWTTALLALPAGPGRTLHVQSERATATLVNVPDAVLVVSTAGHGDSRTSYPMEQEAQTLGGAPGNTTLHLLEGGEARVVCGAPDWDLATHGSRTRVAPPDTRIVTDGGSPFSRAGAVGGAEVSPVVPHTVTVVEGHERAELEHCTLVATGGTVHLGGWDRPLRLGRWLNESRSTHDPITGSGQYVYDSWFLLLDLPRADLHAPGEWVLAARTVEGLVNQKAQWHGLQDAVGLDADRPDPHLLELEGDLVVQATLTSDQARWAVAGDATNVHLDKEAVWVTAEEVLVGAGLLALLAPLLLFLRSIATVVLGRAAPAALRLPPLGHPRRRRILEAVHEHQPVRLPDLQGLTGISRGALRYHLRVLTSTDVLQAHTPPGRRNTTYMLNSGSLMFDAREVGVEPDGGTVPAGVALSVAHSNPLRHAILSYLRENGPATADELGDHLAGPRGRPARSTLTYHLRLLEQAGLATVGRTGRRKTYRCVLDARAVPTEQYARYLRQERALPLVALLARRDAVPCSQVYAHLQRDGWTARSARRLVDRLVAVALLEPCGDGVRLARVLKPLADDVLARGAS